jgi:hypothetical protein
MMAMTNGFMIQKIITIGMYSSGSQFVCLQTLIYPPHQTKLIESQIKLKPHTYRWS